MKVALWTVQWRGPAGPPPCGGCTPPPGSPPRCRPPPPRPAPSRGGSAWAATSPTPSPGPSCWQSTSLKYRYRCHCKIDIAYLPCFVRSLSSLRLTPGPSKSSGEGWHIFGVVINKEILETILIEHYRDSSLKVDTCAES